MHNVDIRNISLGQIHYFIKVAEYGNITKAAAFFNLTQPTLSKKIMSMEEQLDLQLFIRGKKAIRLTPAGRYLYEQWKDSVGRLEENVQHAHILQQGYTKQIVLACMDSFRPDLFMLPLVDRFRESYPDVLIRIESDSAQDIRKMLIHGEADVIFSVLYDFKEKEMENIAWTRLGKCTHAACMKKENPLSQKECLQIGDMKQSDFLCISPMQLPEYIQEVQRVCRKGGFLPNITNYVSSANSLTLNLMTDNDVFLCDRYYADMKEEEHCLIPISDTESGFIMAWRKDSGYAYCDIFVQFALEYMKENGLDWS